MNIYNYLLLLVPVIGLVMVLAAIRVRRRKPRPMTGFWNTLSDEQKKAILENDAPDENHGDPKFALPRS